MPRTLACRAVLFDCDGVLVDSRDSGNRAWTTWAERHGLDPVEVLAGVHGRRSVETVALFIAEPERPAALRIIDDLEVDDATGTRPIPGAAELVAALTRAGVPWAVVTSAGEPLLRARIGAAGITLPAAVVTAGDVSAGKPSPEGYLLAAGKLGVPIEQCLVVEDSPTGIRAGRAAGAGFVLGVGPEAAQAAPDALIADLTGCRWDGTGLVVEQSGD